MGCGVILGPYYPCGHPRTPQNSLLVSSKSPTPRCRECRRLYAERRRKLVPSKPRALSVNYPCGHPRTPGNSQFARKGKNGPVYRCKECCRIKQQNFRDKDKPGRNIYIRPSKVCLLAQVWS